MTVPFIITDGSGTKNKAIVHSDGALGAIIHPEPPLLPQKTELFRQFFTDDGLSAGSNDMGVDGSSTDIDFWISAHAENDRYIISLNLIVGYGTTGKPFQWADGSALTNGTQLIYSSLRGDKILHDGIKTNQDLLRVNRNGVVLNWEVRHVNANNDFGYFVAILLTDVMPPFGIKLDAGSTQRLTARVRDNVGLDADSFNIIASGFDRFNNI